MTKNHQTRTARGLRGEIRVAPDKSISHRSLIFSALAEGESRIENLLLGEDVLRTLTIINELGVKTSRTATTLQHGDPLTVRGVGLHGFTRPEHILCCGNSGTTMRLMLGLLAAQGFCSTLTGDDSLNKRPMERVMGPLKKMGARFEVFEQDGQRMIAVGPQKNNAHRLKGIQYHSPVASAQIKTALLLAGLYAAGKTTVSEPSLSRNHTEIMLQAMGAPVVIEGMSVTVSPPVSLRPIQMTIPGDVSSAAFFIVAALITNESDLVIRGVNLNPTRTGMIDVLLKMGAAISITHTGDAAGEPVGDLRVRSSRLRNISIGGALIPRLIDEIPILALAGAVAEGEMVIADARELRVKETDRIAAICSELKKLGVAVRDREDGLVINGGALSGKPRQLKSYGDHRMAMMETVAALLLKDPVEIEDVACVQTSFPGFFDLLNQVMKYY